jgi:hypothetical protein
MKKEICDQLITETEQSFEKMGMDFYQTMQKAPAILEKWKGYAPLFQKLWCRATNREQLTELLLAGPDSSPEEMETVLTIIRTLPYLLRSYLQDTAKALPPSPGGRPRELTAEQRKEVCLKIGHLYGMGVEMRDAQKRMAQQYNVSLRTIERAWQERAKWNSASNKEKN